MPDRQSHCILVNGTIHTMAPSKRIVEAVAVSDGLIVAAGTEAEARRSASRGCERINLGGKVVLPGFIDCHTHFIQMGLDSMCVDLSRTRTLEQALQLIKNEGERKPPGEWVIATNWKESGWPGGRFITRQDLDLCCPENPVVAHRVCGHLSTVNTRAMEELGIDSDTKDADPLKGILRESALGIPREATEPDSATTKRALEISMRMAHRLGVTSINDNGRAQDLAVYLDSEKRGRLRVRVWFNTPCDGLDARLAMNIPTGLGSDRLKLGGLKVFCDGALGARTAALSREYADDPGNKGSLVIERSRLAQIVETANNAGIQMAIHAIGDAGIGAAVSAYSKTAGSRPLRGLRNRIEHLELPTPAQLGEMRRLGVVASMQPNFIGEWGGTDGMYIARLGAERTARNNPFREVLGARVRLVFGSDCMPFSPIYGIHSVVNAPHPSQKLSAEEAIAAYTRDAAYASFEESVKGTIEKGKLADLVVLSGDPFTEPGSLRRIRVLRTVMGGETVHAASKGKI